MARDWGRTYWDWLTVMALPLWAAQGVDTRGGFQESLGLDGTPISAQRRSRVQGRQSFVFAHAGRLGWDGAWAPIAPVGLSYLDRHCRRPDGLYATLSAPDGTVIDNSAMTYDQAFVLLAQSELHRHDPHAGWEGKARELLARIETLRRHSGGGFVEADGRFLSNPHMHLFEACLAWTEAGGAPVWGDIAHQIVALALDRFIIGDTLREVFDADWAVADGDAGQVVEPGHQFEWAWLLERWARRTGGARAHEAARVLFAAGVRGVDPARGAAVDRTDPYMTPTRPAARLWPQTEWLKAACLLSDAGDIDAAASALWRYLKTPQNGMKPGLWRDKMQEDGSFVDEPAPASSLYHIICAVASLKDLT